MSGIPPHDPSIDTTDFDPFAAAGNKKEMPLRRFPGYETISVLGVGGMGVVYQARQTALNRLVAIKTLRNYEDALQKDLDRFRFEAEIVAQLQHPNIVRLYHIGEQGGQPFLAFEFIDGGSLAKKIVDLPPSPREAAILVETIARAVHVAHLHGVIHRDLTPNNILLAADGTPRIADFGLARAQNQSAALTESIAGTASYMAPEQAWGDVPGQSIGPTTDVYGLGAILYELITGRPPFKASSSQKTLQLVYSTPPQPPRTINPEIPRDLETICLRCLEKDPTRRFSSAEALAEELRRFLSGEPIHSRPVSRGEKLWLWSRRNPVIAGLSAALVGVVLISFVIVTMKMFEAQRAEASERRRADELDAALYRNQFLLAHDAFESNDTGRAATILAATNPARRSIEWNYLQHLLQGERRKLPWNGERIGSLIDSPTADVVAVASSVDVVRLVDSVSGKVLHELRGHEVRVVPPAYSPDGKQIASVGITGNDSWIRIWDVSSGQEVKKIGPLKGVGVAIRFVPSGDRLLSVSIDNISFLTRAEAPTTIESWDIASSKRISVQAGPATDAGFSGGAVNASISPNGRLFAWTPSLPLPPGSKHRREIQICESESGKLLHTLTHPLNLLGAQITFSPDSEQLVSYGDDGSAIVWNVSNGKPVAALKGHAGGILAVAFRPDGKMLATAGTDFGIKIWDLAGGEEARTLRGHESTIAALSFGHDGRRLLSADTEGAFFAWNQDQPQVQTLHDRGAIFDLSFASGELLLSSDIAGKLRFWQFGDKTQSKLIASDCLGFVLSHDRAKWASIGTDGSIRCGNWNANSPSLTLIPNLPAASSFGSSPLIFSSDGSLLAYLAKDRDQVIVMDLASGKMKSFTSAEGKFKCMAFRPDGELLAAGREANDVLFWDMANGKSLGEIKTEYSVHGLAFRPGSSDLAIFSRQNRVAQIWDSQTRELRVKLAGHKSEVTCGMYTSDGRRFITGSADRTVRVWDADSGQELLVLKDAPKEVMKLTVSPDDSRLAAAVGIDPTSGQIIVWSMPSPTNKRE